MCVNKIKFATFNCNGLVSHKKRFEFESLIKENKIDICLVQESKLSNKHTIYFPDYEFLRNSNGQAAILFKRNYKYTQIQIDLKAVQYIAIKIKSGEKDLNIISLYIPHSIKISELKKDLKTLESIFEEEELVIAGGDFNAHHSKWGCPTSNEYGKNLYTWMIENSHNISQHTQYQPTRKDTKSIIDFFLTSPDIQPNFMDNRITHSDHNLITLEVQLQKITKVTFNGINYNRIDWLNCIPKLETFFKKVESHLIATNLDTPDQIDNQITTLTDGIVNTVKACTLEITTGGTNSFNKYPPHIAVLYKIKNYWRKKYYKERAKIKVCDVITFYLYNSWQDAEKIFNKKFEEAKQKTFRDTLSNIGTAENALKTINTLSGRKRREKSNWIQTDQGITSNKEEICEIFEKYYKELFENRDPNNLELNKIQNNFNIQNTHQKFTNLSNKANPKIHFFTNPVQIETKIKKLKNKKSAGDDLISNYLLKKLVHLNRFKEILAIIFNCCLNISYFPKKWKTAILIPISKVKFDPQNPNYVPKVTEFRPISLTSNVGKILEDIILEKLWAEVKEKKLLPENQFGFRPDHATTDILYVFNDSAVKSVNLDESVAACSLDLEKAFDSVWIAGLLFKLKRMKVDPKIYRIIQSFLTNRSATILFNGEKSKTFNITRGVPQGTKLGPLLYSLYIADMPQNDMNVHSALYADDTLVWSSHKRPQKAARRVSKHVQRINSYFLEWGIKINAAKTKLVIFNNGGRGKASDIKESKIKIGNEVIRPQKQFKYLGLIWDHKLNFNTHVKTAISKSKKCAGQLRFLMKNKNMALKFKKQIIKSIIWPILTYGFPIWANISRTYYNSIEKMYRKLIRTSTGLYRKNTFKMSDEDVIFREWFTIEEIYKAVETNGTMDDLEKLLLKFQERLNKHKNGIVKRTLKSKEGEKKNCYYNKMKKKKIKKKVAKLIRINDIQSIFKSYIIGKGCK